MAVVAAAARHRAGVADWRVAAGAVFANVAAVVIEFVGEDQEDTMWSLR